MKNSTDYWTLFYHTGIPAFYLTYRMEENEEHLV